MLIKILPIQIPFFWDAIKFACTQADEVDIKDRASYYNELLQALLSDTAQCFVWLDSNRVLNGLTLTRVMVNKVTGKKELFIQCAYTMQKMDDETVKSHWSTMQAFAEKNQCSYMTFQSRNPRIWEIADILGCGERYRSFALELGDK